MYSNGVAVEWRHCISNEGRSLTRLVSSLDVSFDRHFVGELSQLVILLIRYTAIIVSIQLNISLIFGGKLTISLISIQL